jgi:Reverse transcriptase (RNA-dependent DNA polymerase)
VTVFEEKEMVE